MAAKYLIALQSWIDNGHQLITKGALSVMRPLGGVVEVHNLTSLLLPSAHQIFTLCIHICVGFDNSTSIA